MNLPKKTRKALYEAKGPIWINWPQESPDPHPGHRYPVYSEEDGSKLFSVRVEQTKERGTKAKVRIDNDPVRVLPGLQGVRLEDGSYETEPERVSAETEAEYAMRGRAATVVRGATHRQEEKIAAKGSEATSPRSERAKARHKRSLESTSERSCENVPDPARPAHSGD